MDSARSTSSHDSDNSRRPAPAPAQGETPGMMPAPAAGTPGALLRLQRAIGNRAVSAAITRARPGVIARTPAEAAAAEELRDAMEGLGTDEDAIFSALARHSGSAGLRNEYVTLTGRTLERDLRDDLSGSELDRALRLMFGHDSSVWDTAVRLRDAMSGMGTDEDVVLEILRAQTTEAARMALRGAYRDAAGRILITDIYDDFSGDELKEVLLAYNEGPPSPDMIDAIELRNAMGGLGTDEAAVYRVLQRRTTPAELETLKTVYQRLTGRSIEADIRDDFSGEELTRALQLLGIGEFTNELPQDMFEGKVTVVRGRFDWRFEAGELKVNVNA
ncbi:MAG: hypothetical protein IT304_08395, partial [Dehalococcoidia bacterium]|nr:hypothetical protein [Dehalococcoidia bacterium]